MRAGTHADTDRVLELVRRSLGEGTIPRERAYWEWKHFQNPFGHSPMLLAEADGELVGLRVFMRWAWQAGGETVRAVRAVDTATHPSWQGRGIFKKLTLRLVEQMRDEGVSLVFNTPNGQSRPGYLKMGWSSLGRSDLWVRPLRPLRAAGALAARRLRGTEARPPLPGSFPDAAVLFEDAAALEGLERARPQADPRLRTPRTADYLRWRYAAVPGFRYHALLEAGAGGSAAVVFRYKEQGPLLELRICDLLLDERRGSAHAMATLLRRLRRESGADYVAAMAAAGTEAQKALLRGGFLPAPRLGPIFTVRPLDVVGPADPLSRRSWNLSIGDLELF